MKGALAAAVGAASLFIGACGGGTTAAPTATPPTAAQAAAPRATTGAGPVTAPPAPVTTSGRTEVGLVAAPRNRLVETLAAVQRGDFAGARAALDLYDGEWNGIEVYVNTRSRALYGEIESHYQADVSAALDAAQPDAPQITSLLQSMIGQYDEAIRLSDSGPPLHRLFDDVATVRTVRAPLRRVSPALKAGDLSRAKSNFAAFKGHWSEAQPLIAARSADVAQQTQAALDAADRSLAVDGANAAATAELVDALMARYNGGVNALNAAARNADVGKTAFAAEDVQAAALVGAIEREVRASLSPLSGGDRAAASNAARRAAGARFEAAASTLAAKGGADAGVKKALDEYVAAVDGLADVGQARTAGQAALDAVLVGQQTVAGQFWTEPGFQTAYAAALDGL
ncbi:MAG TPA: hypothetical protein VGQ62_21385 [Chloroflexota bacterium]|nr:hypothetical protein [Chloroflexota bacterium]